jgi:hypothetical protein
MYVYKYKYIHMYMYVYIYIYLVLLDYRLAARLQVSGSFFPVFTPFELTLVDSVVFVKKRFCTQCFNLFQ